jgi:hypothetical protein
MQFPKILLSGPFLISLHVEHFVITLTFPIQSIIEIKEMNANKIIFNAFMAEMMAMMTVIYWLYIYWWCIGYVPGSCCRLGI